MRRRRSATVPISPDVLGSVREPKASSGSPAGSREYLFERRARSHLLEGDEQVFLQ